MTTHTVSLVIWACTALLLVGVGVVAAVSHGRLATVADFGRVLMGTRVRGAVVIVIWMWLGWHFFAR
ncbi:MAG TPA: DUF6186 family protein [Acidimicrobiales bacterium]|nr:DUF6186 family protein [Acidimicrobiales bacterium]